MKVKLTHYRQPSTKLRFIWYSKAVMLLVLSLLVWNTTQSHTASSDLTLLPLEALHPDHVFEWFNPEHEEVYQAPIEVALEHHHFANINRFDLNEVSCMADAIYWEARGEPLKGQLGVGYVVLNRMANPDHWPNTACGVVYQKHQYTNNQHCQFSWVCEHGGLARKNTTMYQYSYQVALAVLDNLYPNPIGESVFFHSEQSLSYKFSAYTPTVTLGGHYFYSL